MVCFAELPGWVFAESSSVDLSYFTADQRIFIASLSDTLIPETDTPGAIEAGVPLGFETLMQAWASDDRRSIVLQTIEKLLVDLNNRVDGNFALARSEQRLQALSKLDSEAYASASNQYDEYRFIKTMLVRLYYASELGATQELNYDPFPGGYDGDIAFVEVGRTWATIEVGAY